MALYNYKSLHRTVGQVFFKISMCNCLLTLFAGCQDAIRPIKNLASIPKAFSYMQTCRQPAGKGISNAYSYSDSNVNIHKISSTDN